MAEQWIGKTIKAIRPMSEAEIEAEGWAGLTRGYAPTVIEFLDGSKLYASQDEVGNGPGALFGVESTGENVYLVAVADD